MYKINMEIFFSLFLKWEQFFHNLYFWRFLNIYDWIIYLFIDDKLEFNWKIFFFRQLEYYFGDYNLPRDKFLQVI